MPELCVVATPAPLPVALSWRPAARAMSARAREDASFAARARYRVHERGASQCVDERRLSATCKRNDPDVRLARK